MKNMHKLLAILLSIMTVISCLSGVVFAAEEEGPDLTCYMEIDYTRYMEDHTAVYGFGSPTHAEVDIVADKGYATFTSTGNDPNFVYNGKGVTSQLEAVTSDKIDYIVIKYRTTEIGRCEFYTGRTDGVQWANPMESSHIDWGFETTGNWELKIVDASAVWGNVEGVYLNNFRFDFGGNCPGVIDFAFLRFYATLEGAEACVAAEQESVTETRTVAVDDPAVTKDGEGNAFYGEGMIPLTYVPAAEGAAECYTYEETITRVKEPVAPFNPSNVDLKLLLDGTALNATGERNGMSSECLYDFDKGYVTYVTDGGDPFFYLTPCGTPVEVGPYAVIKYRSEATQSDAFEMFIGQSNNPQGPTDNIQCKITRDGEWHTAVLYVGGLADYNGETNVVNHIRFDPLRSDSADGAGAGESIDVEYIAFFGDEESALYYAEADIHELPGSPTHTVTFVADGIDIAVLEYTEGDTALKNVPEVPAKEGYTGVWESYTLGKTDLVVNAVYTEIPSEPTETDPSLTEPTEPDVEDPTEEETTEETTTQATDATAEETTPEATEPGKSGCGSVMGMGAVAVLAMAAAVLSLKKKED